MDEETEFEREQREMFEAFHNFYAVPPDEELFAEQDEGAQ